MQTEEEKKAQETASKEHAALIERMKKALGERVSDVRVTARLADSPACLVLGEHDLGAQMRRILEAAGQKAPGDEAGAGDQPVASAAATDRGDWRGGGFADLSMLLFEQATLAEGGQLPEPAAFVQRLNRLLLAMR